MKNSKNQLSYFSIIFTIILKITYSMINLNEIWELKYYNTDSI